MTLGSLNSHHRRTRNFFCRKALLHFGSHDSPPIQRIAAETWSFRWEALLWWWWQCKATVRPDRYFNPDFACLSHESQGNTLRWAGREAIVPSVTTRVHGRGSSKNPRSPRPASLCSAAARLRLGRAHTAGWTGAHRGCEGWRRTRVQHERGSWERSPGRPTACLGQADRRKPHQKQPSPV